MSNTRGMKKLAREAVDDAYAPYSDFHVGACVAANGSYYTGANVELAGRTGFHAEQLAVTNAIQDGVDELRTIAVSCEGRKGQNICALCLHTLNEFCSDINIYIDEGDSWRKTSLSVQLPSAYTRGSREGHNE